MDVYRALRVGKIAPIMASFKLVIVLAQLLALGTGTPLRCICKRAPCPCDPTSPTLPLDWECR